MSATYPFSAVVGQEPLKLALLLCAIDPALGGVLVRGARGVAKTTLARALAAFVPGPFVELPLGATEERVTGSIDLGGALREGRVALSEGLLARAHQGVLYVDEVNLLPDGLVDLLLDAAASGVSVVERDGISHRQAARFVLIGTMNPEEGELRPQLTDRFGLAVNAAAEIAPRERAQIIGLRLEHDRDPAAFAARYEAEERALAERCARARARLESIPLDPAALAEVTRRCYEARVEGVRADLAMLRAARAHAAWHGRAEIALADIDAVAELALRHRRTSGSSSSGPTQSGGGSPGAASSTPSAGAGDAPAAVGGRRAFAPAAEGGEREARADGDWGARDVVAVPVVPVSRELLARLPSVVTARRPDRARSQSARGMHRADAPRIDWFRTLLAHRTGGPTPRYRSARTRALWIVAVDCSASMLRKGALGHAKGVACELGRRARAKRAAMHLITFGGQAARVHRAIVRGAPLDRALIALGAGGGTPLRHALIDALRVSRKHPAAEQRLFLLSDGRSRAPLDDLARIGQAMTTVVIDCERARPRLGGAQRIAERLHADYMRLD
jgi:magnesium chelatase subunit D